ncbi:MAG: hydrogenase maturation protease [Gammaproteobacteria bacterium]|nr:hydrogenase maturation protease [Gammaproteobacteria bacterium]
MTDVRIIGIGSPFGNDSLGWQVIEMLKANDMLATFPHEHLELIAADRPGLNLIQMLQDAEFVILVDAICDPNRHGTIMHLTREELVVPEVILSSHRADVASAIALADKLHQLPGKMILIGLGIDPALNSPLMEADMLALASEITRELETYFMHAAAS